MKNHLSQLLAIFTVFVFATNAEALQSRSFPKTTSGVRGSGMRPPSQGNSSNRGGASNRGSSNRSSSARGQGSSSHRGHGHSNHHHHSHNRNYRPSYRYGGYPSYSYLNVNPYGSGFSYRSNGFGISIGTSRFYRPTYNVPYYYPGVISTYPTTNSYYPGYGNSYLPDPSIYRTTSPSIFIDSTEPRSNVERLMTQARIDQLNPGSAGVNEAQTFSVIRTNPNAVRSQKLAEESFKAGKYDDAVAYARQAKRLDGRNGLVHLFAAQTNFASGDYEQAVIDIGNASRLIPSDQWNYVVKNFRQFYGQNDYVAQTDELSAHIGQNPMDINGHILRGFQYGALGYEKAAAADLQNALKIEPDNDLASQLMVTFGGKPVVEAPVVKQPIPIQNIPPAKQIQNLPVGNPGDDLILEAPIDK